SAVQNHGLGCKPTHNKMLLTTVSVSMIMQIVFIYVPVIQSVFQVEELRMVWM
ncbi:hypothetical protein ARMGADRAFT_918660, partial [Armillaria gallica]